MIRNVFDRCNRFVHRLTTNFRTQRRISTRPSRSYLETPGRTLDRLIDTSSVVEKIILAVLIFILIASAGTLVWEVNRTIAVTKPSSGGSLTEGVVGSPQFINPLLASSDADKDLVSLVYAGLLKKKPDGTLVYDLAKDVSVSDDGTTYTVTLKPDVTFHDGTPVTARDVAFTVRQAQDPQLRSTARGDWSGVDVSVDDQRTVTFSLDEAYSPFINNLTLGILPAHIWKSLDATQMPSSPHNNFSPVGAGPYKVVDSERQEQTGLTTYQLKPFEDYALGKPYIDTLTVRSFSDNQAMVDALKNGTIDSAGGLDTSIVSSIDNEEVQINTAHLPRVFAVFFNQNRNDLFTDEPIREALSLAIDKQQIIDNVLNGYGTAVDSPLPAGLVDDASSTSTPERFQHIPEAAAASSSSAQARAILDDEGWELNEDNVRSNGDTTLSFSLTTADTPELVTTAHMLRDAWEKIGVEVKVEVYSSGNLNQQVIRPRQYEALLFGEIIGRGNDFYPFWHSSQQNDPGLNVAQYANIDVDELLEKMRNTHDPATLRELYHEFATIVAQDNPAVFLYTPQYIYATPNKLQAVTIGPMTTPPQRFNTIHDWYIDTHWIWRGFDTQPTRKPLQPVFDNNQ